MKSEKGITLTMLVIYVIVASIVISIMSLVSNYFFSNIRSAKQQDKYVLEFNKFNMFFVEDINKNNYASYGKNNNENEIIFDDGTDYIYIKDKKSIYRNNKKIVGNVIDAKFKIEEIKPSQNHNTTKRKITVTLEVGKTNNSFRKEIGYILKYW